MGRFRGQPAGPALPAPGGPARRRGRRETAGAGAEIFRRAAGRRVMARDGYKIFDSDTHVGPDAAILSRYLSEAEKDRLAGSAADESRDRSGPVPHTKGPPRPRRP